MAVTEKVPLHHATFPMHRQSHPSATSMPFFRSKLKHVRFAKDSSFRMDNPHAVLSEHDCNTLWYSLQELFAMREEVRSAVQHQQGSNLTRGMELYGSKERQHHRWLTIQCIRSACRKQMSHEKIAEISRQCSAGCVQVAILQAMHDYVAIYPVPPTLFLGLPPVSSIQPTFPFSMRKRRRDPTSGTRTAHLGGVLEKDSPSHQARWKRNIMEQNPLLTQDTEVFPLLAVTPL